MTPQSRSLTPRNPPLYVAYPWQYEKGDRSAMAGSTSFLGSVRRFFHDYVRVMETRGSFGQLVQRATEDPALRQRLMQSPKQVLAEAGITLPAGLEVEIVENTDKVIHLVLPPLLDVSEAEGGAQ
jgi:Nitrile hydratase, alpha chain